MKNCETCRGSGLVPVRDENGKIINLMPPEECPDCNGTGVDQSSDDSNKDQEHGNSLLDWAFNLLKNQNPFQV